MIKTILGILFLLLGVAILLFDFAGNHGKILFRPLMIEDWIMWGSAITFLFIGIKFLVKKQIK